MPHAVGCGGIEECRDDLVAKKVQGAIGLEHDRASRTSCTPSTTRNQVACGDDHTVCVSNLNVMYAWGNGMFGRLGSGIDRPPE